MEGQTRTGPGTTHVIRAILSIFGCMKKMLRPAKWKVFPESRFEHLFSRARTFCIPFRDVLRIKEIEAKTNGAEMAAGLRRTGG